MDFTTTSRSLQQYLPKVKRLFTIVVHFFSFQILIQLIDALSGLLIIRQLAKAEYAYFGIASTVAVSLINIAIGGLGSYLISEGIKVKSLSENFSSLYAEVEKFIAKKKIIVIGVSFPIIIWLFLNNNLASFRLFFFITLIVLDVLMRIRMQVLQSVFNIWEKYNVIQAITLSGSVLRIFFVIGFSFFFTAELAYTSLVISYAVQLYLLQKRTKKYFIKCNTDSKERYPFLQKIYNSQLPVNLYNYVDAQLVIFILTYFGNTLLLADVNAAGKLSLIVVSINAFINNFITVQFAKINNRVKFIKLLWLSVFIFILIYITSIFLVINFPGPFIWLIGEKYRNIAPFLYLTVICLCIGNFSGLIYAINYSKMWIRKTWIAIPVTLALQIAMLKFMPPKNFEHVWFYAIASAIPSLLLNILYTYNGVKKLKY